MSSCPDPARLRDLLDGTLADPDQAGLQAHLETCPRCQQTLEDLVADRADWADVARHLGGARPEVDADDGNAEDTRTPSEPGADLPLAFLSPSDRPDALGRLGHYEVLEVVGRGGMGVVLRAFDERLHRVVAIKVMAPQLATSATARKRFTREARVAAAVSHDHVVTIHAVEEANGLPYLVMQFVAGLSLQARLDRDGPLPVPDIVRIGMQAAAGLASAHAQGLVHRDVKPANILLENGVERVKLTDFGLARAADDGRLTHSGVVAGTPQYMSPEQAEGKPVDARSDLFSLGSVLYAMCTGRPPFRARSMVAILKRVCEDTPSPVREANPETPDWLVELIGRLQAKDPAERYQSAAEVAQLLGRYLAHLQHPSQVPAPTPAPAMRRQLEALPRGRRLSWAMAAALLALTSGLGLTEATGVTNVRATVTRVFTPDGTLVVETDDPTVKVTVAGDGGLEITGAGLEEIRLRPGSYRVAADRDGQRVPLERELVTVTRGGREIVKVKLEAAPSVPVAKAEVGAFVLLGAGPERRVDSLAEAVLGSADGDTIEIRGNGPFVSPPVDLGERALTIRAGAGYRPVLRFVPGVAPDDQLLRTSAPLVLEGLEIREANKGRSQPALVGRSLIYSEGDMLALGACRLLREEPAKEPLGLVMGFSRITLRNCCLYNPKGALVEGGIDDPVTWVVENCVGIGSGPLVYVNCGHPSNGGSVAVRRNTVYCEHFLMMGLSTEPDGPTADKAGMRGLIGFDVSSNVVSPQAGVLCFEQLEPYSERKPWPGIKEAWAVVSPIVGWSGQGNLYPPGSRLIHWHQEPGGRFQALGPADLTGWDRSWGPADRDLTGRVISVGGDLGLRIGRGADQFIPEDFRLRSVSAGYRAGKDGKDLGADVDLVGPGAAYERWKKTPDYQQWLQEIGQLKK